MIPESVDVDLATPESVGPTSRKRPALALVQLVGGAMILAIGSFSLESVGLLRAALVLVGVFFTYRGISGVLAWRLGREVSLGTWLAVGWLVTMGMLAIAEPILPLGESKDTSATLGGPRLLGPDLLSDHPLGTNNFGLDQLARIVGGARISLVVALSAASLGLLVGGLIGVLAGYYRKWVDTVIGVATDTVLAFPALILLLALASVVEPTLGTLSLALAFLTVPTYIRIARANTMSVMQREYVEAARSMGASDRRIITFEIIPNVLLPLLSYALVSLSILIVAEASLSFLGLGVAPPNPTWGNMIAEGNGGTAEKNPHIVLVPGTVLFLTVLSLNLLGERARLRWDPIRSASA